MMGNVLFGPKRPEWDKLTDIKGPEWVPLLVLGAALITFGIFPSLLMDLVNNGVAPLFARAGLGGMIGGGF
jgi:NADH-quinone oxidoreductase subunit M